MHTIHKYTLRIRRAIHKCTQEIHTRAHNPEMHAREPHTGRSTNARERATHRAIHKCTREIHTLAHAIQAKASALLFLLTEWSSNTVVPVISCTTNRESFELVSALRMSINKCFCICGFFWDCHSAVLTHKCAQAYLYTLLMEWMK